MNVRFKGGMGIVYKAFERNVPGFDEVLKKYTNCHNIAVLGTVSSDFLEDTDEEANAVDVAIHLTNG